MVELKEQIKQLYYDCTNIKITVDDEIIIIPEFKLGVKYIIQYREFDADIQDTIEIFSVRCENIIDGLIELKEKIRKLRN